MRVALYARVSTEEQVKHGLSIDAQLAALRAWARDGGHVVAGEYVDLGVSARKDPAKRPELQRLLGDLDKVDAVVFTKLDRWTRNIKGYFRVQEQLDARKVAWIAIQEDYETVTASGRFKVNIMLSVAENEADRTSERIKVVFDRKILSGEYIGNRPPLGYSVEGKKFFVNADADAVRACYAAYRQTGSIRRAVDCLHAFGHPLVYSSVQRLLSNSMYAGRYRDNPEYCPPIISPEEFDEVQRMLERRSFRQNRTGRVFLFSGLIRCGSCGRPMAACAAGGSRNPYYRCNHHYLDKSCDNGHGVSEPLLESWLLENIVPALSGLESGLVHREKKKPADVSAIRRKLDRLKDLYIDGYIEKSEYLRDREALLAQIPREDPQPDSSPVRDLLLRGDFREHYNALSRESRRALWRSVIDHVTATPDRTFTIYFSP